MKLLTNLRLRVSVIFGAMLLTMIGLMNLGDAGRVYAVVDNAEDTSVPLDVSAAATLVIDQYCISCHGPNQQKGGIRLDALETIDTVDLNELYLKMQDTIHFEEMPPAKQPQPSDAERQALLDWLGTKLTGADAKKLEEKLRRPEAGNYVDHDALFSGEHADKPGFTYDRRWLISEYIFESKFNRILDQRHQVTIDGTRVDILGSRKRRFNLTNPFLLPQKAGVRYYANETLHGGHLLTMLSNAKVAADKMFEINAQRSDYLPAIGEVLELEREHEQLLETRREFLTQHIDRLLKEYYGERHEALLPEFVSIAEPFDPATLEGVKKPLFHLASPGREEMELVYRTMAKVGWETLAWPQVIEACEREWFYAGHHPNKIAARITVLQRYEAEWKDVINRQNYREKLAPRPYAPLNDEHMNAIESALLAHREPGDAYDSIIARCMEQWGVEYRQIRIDAGPPSDEMLGRLIDQVFTLINERAPNLDEREQHIALLRSYVAKLGRERGIHKMLQTAILKTEFVYRDEFGTGEPDPYGRRLLSPRDASYALAYALTDQSPDAELRKAAAEGRLNTREDYEREVRRMLARRDIYYIIDEGIAPPQHWESYPSFTNMPVREHRFLRDFFGYPKLLGLFKDDKRFGGDYERARRRLVIEADLLVQHILEQDRDVFGQLLTTDSFYVFHSGNNEQMRAGSEWVRTVHDYFRDLPWQEFTPDDIRQHAPFIEEMGMKGINIGLLKNDKSYDPTQAFRMHMEAYTRQLAHGQIAAAPYDVIGGHGTGPGVSRYGATLPDPEVTKFFNINVADWDYPTTQPAPVEHRKGMLTHPAWLIAFSQNTESDPIHRGKWIREKLLADTIPDVPITVDAVIPEDPHKTLRQRMVAKTGEAYCWTCHVKMEPLGLPFEMYDDFGRYRTEERLEHPDNLIRQVPDKQGPHVDMRDIYKVLPVDATGELVGTRDNALDGEVDNALELIDRLSKSDRVRQSIVRHAFRYFMGRNETLSDSKTLIEADRAYVESGGSFDELIVSLLTSDSFIYRKPVEDDQP